MQQNEISRETRLKEKLDKEVKQLHADMEAKMGDIRALNLQGQKAKEEQQRLEQQLKEQKVSNRSECISHLLVMCNILYLPLYVFHFIFIYLLMYLFYCCAC